VLSAALALSSFAAALEDAPKATPPSVRIVAPSPNDLVLGSVPITLAVDGYQQGDTVEVFVDGRKVGSRTAPPFGFTWDAGDAPRPHSISAVLLRHGVEAASSVIKTRGAGFVSSVTTRAVSLTPVVIDAQGHYVTGLTQDEFVVKDDGVEQAIETFESGESPLSAVLVLDVSGSMLLKIGLARLAAHRFLDALRPGDDAALVTFSSTLLDTVRFTKDRARLHEAIDATRPNGETALYDATAAALRLLKPVRHRKAIVLLTDGEDNRSRLSVNQVIEMARASEVSIYAVAEGLDESKVLRVYLDRLANETGGRSYFIGHMKKLPEVFDGIVTELKSQYFLTYTPKPSRPGTWHQIDVKVKVAGASVRARKAYLVE
jgi:Ca-activated chloride channel family protein